MIGETTLRSALVEKVRENDPLARVHRRWRYPAQNRIAEWLNLFRDEDKKINCYMIRRVRRIPIIKDGIPPRLVATIYTYEIRFYFGLVDDEDDAKASEEIAQARIDSLGALLEADTTLGLGACVTHSGLTLPTDFEDVVIGDWPAHRSLLRCEITVANVSC